MDEKTTTTDELHHCIAIGRGATATKPYEIVIAIELSEELGVYTMLRTVMSLTEWQYVHAVVRRLANSALNAGLSGQQED